MEERLTITLPVSELLLLSTDAEANKQIARMDGEDELADRYEHIEQVIDEALFLHMKANK